MERYPVFKIIPDPHFRTNDTFQQSWEKQPAADLDGDTLFHTIRTSTAAIPAQKYMQHTSTTTDLNPLPQPKPALYPAPTLYFRLRNKRNILPLQ